jgi:hypothetical protein
MICSFLLVCVSVWTGLWAIPKDMAFRAAEACGVANARRELREPGEDTALGSDATCADIRQKVGQRAKVVDIVCVEASLYPDATLIRYHDDLKTLYIAFPGWKSWADTWICLSFRPKPLEGGILEKRKGHGGFVERYNQLQDKLLEGINAHKEDVDTLVFSGHCMGAGLASRAYIHFKEGFSHTQNQLITLAPVISVLPSIDEDENARYYWFDDDLWRGCSQGLDWIWGRSSIGQGAILSDGKDVSWWNTHRLKRYIDALDPEKRRKKDD